MEATKTLEGTKALEAIEIDEATKTTVCNNKTEIYSRITGYFRPVINWNEGKKQEFKDRKTYSQELVGCACKEGV